MIETIYSLLEKIGYSHPIHPPLTHGPIGAVIVAFILGLAALIGRRQNLLISAYHALIIALILLIPTALAGFMDWQHYYSGAWIFPIQMKIGLAISLLILLCISLIVFRRTGTRPAIKTLLITLCLFNAMSLGYFGGQLVYEGRIPAVQEEFLPGRNIFVNHCSGCHPNGGNILFPNLPLRTAPQLKSYETFIEFVRNPLLPDGSKGPMPSFTQSRLSDAEAQELYNYIINGLANPIRSGDK
jgi:uncharacterized membrane protein